MRLNQPHQTPLQAGQRQLELRNNGTVHLYAQLARAYYLIHSIWTLPPPIPR
jgi:hypothetical protein